MSEDAEEVHEPHDDGCIHCSLDLDFAMPEGLLDAAHRRQVVIFAGAGISTEVATVFPDTVLDLAATRLGIEEPESFPETLQKFQDRFGRTELVRMVKKKFDYIDNFPGPRHHARRFHYELATMPYLRDIVTTNWDLYFEEECAATPFVTGEDIALYDMPGRRVLKVHGSMSNLATLVATESDYAKRLDELGRNVMGGLLRQMLATRTVVFIGYSLRDWNFRRLYGALRADMNDYAPRAFLVSPFATEGQEDEFNLRVIRTSGVRFLRELKQAMVGHCFIDDAAYDYVDELWDALDAVDRVAKNVSHKEFPAVIACWSYHDGMRDACFRIRRLRPSGEYSDRHHVVNLCKTYEVLYDKAYEAERFLDAAYIDGYVNGLMMLLAEEDIDGRELIDNVPLYFIFGADSGMRSEEEFREALEQSRRRVPKVRKKLRPIADGLAEGMVLTHTPFLADAPGNEW